MTEEGTITDKDLLVGSHEDGIGGEADKGSGPVTGGQADDTPAGNQEPSDTDQSKVDEPKRKFKTWEEAEKAHEEATRKITQLGEEKSRVQRRLEEIDKPKDVLKDEIAEKKKAIRAETLEKIRRIPTDDPDREDKIAELWLEAGDKRAMLGYETAESQREGKTAQQKYVDGKLDEAGFKHEKEKDLFWNYILPKMPYHLRNASGDEQMEWGVKKLTELVSDFVERTKQGIEEDGKDKEKLGILGKGSNIRRPGKKSEDAPSTMREELKQLRKEWERGKSP